MVWAGYAVIGVILAPGWPHWPTEGRLAYISLFPVHAAVLWYGTQAVTYRDSGGRHLLNNPWLIWPLFLLFALVTLCTGC